MISRRDFLLSSVGAALGVSLMQSTAIPENIIMCVDGPIEASSLGTTLIHEHILVDFIGADKIDASRWNQNEVIEKIMPLLQELKDLGCNTFIDCTPNYLGRDVTLLKRLSVQSGLNIITNTGYYGGSDNKFLPAHSFKESAKQLSQRWLNEVNNGIDGTSVKPGFIKISVNPDKLTNISAKLIKAAALTHLKSGLTIASHTGPAIPAFEQIEILKKNQVHPNAFIWVHAQMEKDWVNYKRAAHEGAWISLDNVGDDNIDLYTEMLLFMKAEKCLHQTLVSHDAGWYEPGKPNGGNITKYTALFTKLIPSLIKKGITDADLKQLMVDNPREAFTIKIRSV